MQPLLEAASMRRAEPLLAFGANQAVRRAKLGSGPLPVCSNYEKARRIPQNPASHHSTIAKTCRPERARRVGLKEGASCCARSTLYMLFHFEISRSGLELCVPPGLSLDHHPFPLALHHRSNTMHSAHSCVHQHCFFAIWSPALASLVQKPRTGSSRLSAAHAASSPIVQ